MSRKSSCRRGKVTSVEGLKTVRDSGCFHSRGGGSGREPHVALAEAPHGWQRRPSSRQAPAPGCPLSAGLQVLVHEHVEFTVHPAPFIPAKKR